MIIIVGLGFYGGPPSDRVEAKQNEGCEGCFLSPNMVSDGDEGCDDAVGAYWIEEVSYFDMLCKLFGLFC